MSNPLFPIKDYGAFPVPCFHTASKLEIRIRYIFIYNKCHIVKEEGKLIEKLAWNHRI